MPKLRFPGFEGEWEESSLRHFFTKNNDRNKDCYIKNVITNSAEYGLVSQSDFFDKSIAIEENTGNYYIIRRGNFVYNPRKSKTAPFGPFNRYEKNEVGIVSPLYTCLVPMPGINTDYLAWFFRSTVWHRYVYDNGSQGARHDRVNMTDDLLFQIPIRYPKSSEQTQVADFLSLINSRIAAQRKLVELLKKHKRGVIEKLFSSQRWPEVPLCEIAEINPKPSKINDEFFYADLESVEDGVLKNLNLVQKAYAPSRAQRTVRVNDILFQMVRPYQQNNYLARHTFDKQLIASTGYAQLRTKEDPEFISTGSFTRNDFFNASLSDAQALAIPQLTHRILKTSLFGSRLESNNKRLPKY